jgi:hypothetical protein
MQVTERHLPLFWDLLQATARKALIIKHCVSFCSLRIICEWLTERTIDSNEITIFAIFSVMPFHLYLAAINNIPARLYPGYRMLIVKLWMVT